MKQTELRKAVAAEAGITIRAADRVMRALNRLILECMERGEICWLGGLGSFRLRHIPGYTTKHPMRPSEKLIVKARKRIILKAGKSTRDLMQKLAARDQ